MRGVLDGYQVSVALSDALPLLDLDVALFEQIPVPLFTR